MESSFDTLLCLLRTLLQKTQTHLQNISRPSQTSKECGHFFFELVGSALTWDQTLFSFRFANNIPAEGETLVLVYERVGESFTTV